MRMRLGLAVALLGACSPAAPPPRVTESPPTGDGGLPEGSATASAQEPRASTRIPDASPFDGIDDDPMSLQRDTKDGIQRLLPLRDPKIDALVGMGPAHLNQGNKSIARHTIGRRACLEGLQGVVLQTPEQRGRCGADYMVPIYEKGNAASAKTCIDIFEFPNKPCELPTVWVSPMQAEVVCHAEGKRLCDQSEWNLACRADPNGGPDRLYAYGDELDLKICNTSKSRALRQPRCSLQSMSALWETCATDTEPSGAFPKCRSRFGVFDQHGNVAEIMTRLHWDGIRYDQLKGSAWFYTDVAKKPNEPGGYWTNHPDHCNFDPRWHVEPMREASHVNYHLGFRCCKTIEPLG